MSWTYSGNPSVSSRDAARFYLGDTNTNARLLSNEELDFLLSQYPDPLAAAAAAAEALSSFYARSVNKTVGPVSVSYGERGKQFASLADSLWERAGGRNFGVRPLQLYSGGLSESEKTTRRLDSDLVQPRFRRDAHGSRIGSVGPFGPFEDEGSS